MVLLGNKGDMVHLRQVASEEGDILAKDFDCNFREVAAADQVNEVSRINKNVLFSRRASFSSFRLQRLFKTYVEMSTLRDGKTKLLF